MSEETANDTTDDREGYAFIFSFQMGAMTEAVQLGSRTVTVYILVLLAIVGAIFNSDLEGNDLKVAVMTIVLVSIIFAPMALAMAFGIVRGFRDLERSLYKAYPDQCESTDVKLFFKRGRMAAVFLTLCSLLILGIIIVAVWLIQFKSNSNQEIDGSSQTRIYDYDNYVIDKTAEGRA